MPKTVSLFTGCGGSDAGVVACGFDVIMANDIIAYARDVYLANLPETEYIVGDIRKIKRFPKAELLVGCYPCQGYSQGGAREANRKINYLYFEFARALRHIQPKAFIVENVAGLIRSNNKYLFMDQIARFEEAGECGYEVQYATLNAQDYGVPQERKRLIIVGIRGDLGTTYQFPEHSHGPGKTLGYRSIQDAIDGLPEWPENEFCDDPFHWYYLSRNRRREWHEPSRTIVSHMRHVPLHPISPPLEKVGKDAWRFVDNRPARRFSYREAALLQGFTHRYTQHGGDFRFPDEERPSTSIRYNLLRQKYRVVGNAVPPPLFEAVVRALPNVWD